ncbi:ABC transporter substrate-binding protein [Alicyclobacillus cycloheptanicus]|uniref:Iron complex transport system substrate-binding protein n=1 Tax=Alicyclobacillus cycloheptanicus TaxID=1457 RepID=A0ABT9XDL0_9BACL|nr:ABC transporter substrate-binding protein [Alicyclobacillus cycloheptanicus]MDQ0188225.1 iron complex transport system substrate-binding protein [Alicyclobacillus cycloheptanicus]WDM00954.1 ABC transporter substrate-binding protein [Alicyclobacillus cycloheptanicus]
MQSSFRIASLCPSNTELLCALGLADAIIATDSYSDFPPDVVGPLPKLGPDLSIDIAQLAALQPDLVVSSLTVPGMERVVQAVEDAGLAQVTLSPARIEDIVADANTIAQALPTSLRQTLRIPQFVDDFERRLDRVAKATASVAHRPGLYWEWWPQPVFSPGRDNWLTEVSALAGARNIFEDQPGPQVRDETGERVCAANPDVFLAVWTGIPQHKVPLAKIKTRRGAWQQTPAFQTAQLFILSEGLFCRPSPRLLDGLEQLVGLLHPDAAQRAGLARPEAYGPMRTADGTWLGGQTPPPSMPRTQKRRG